MRKVIFFISALILTSCSGPSAQKLSNQEFDNELNKLVKVTALDSSTAYSNKFGNFEVILYKKYKEIKFYGYQYHKLTLGSVDDPFIIYLFPQVIFSKGLSANRTVICQSKECQDITLSYLDVNQEFTPIKLPSRYYGLTPRDVMLLGKTHAPATERLPFILLARDRIKNLTISSEEGTQVITPKDRVNIKKTVGEKICYYWADDQSSYVTQSYRFDACFVNNIYVEGDLADYDLRIIRQNKVIALDPLPKNVILLPSKYKLSPYGLMYLSRIQGIDRDFITNLSYQPRLPK